MVHGYGRPQEDYRDHAHSGDFVETPTIMMPAEQRTSTLTDTRHNRQVSTGRLVCLAAIIGACTFAAH